MAASDIEQTSLICSFPTELLEQIIAHLDNSSLYNTGLTCKDLHYIALRTLFSRNDIQAPADGWLVAYKTPEETLPALRAALFVQNIKQFHYYLNPGVERLLNEVNDMRHFIARLPSVELVKLHFSVVDAWITRRSGSEMELDRDRWLRAFSGLLDVIVARSCTELHITSGSKIKHLYTNSEPGGVPKLVDAKQVPKVQSLESEQKPLKSILRMDRKEDKKSWWSLSALFNRIMCKDAGDQPASMIEENQIHMENHVVAYPLPPLEPRAKLADVSIHSDMLLQYTFFNWTVSTLRDASSSLTRLSFRCGDVEKPTWRSLLKTLSLPVLTDFEVCTDLVVSSPGAAFHDLEVFLSRHPTITSLHLHGVETPSSAPVLKAPILPNLTTLMAHPIWILSILGMRENHPEALSELESIGVFTEYYQSTSRFNYDLLNQALARIAVFPRRITLTVRFMVQYGVSDWFAAQILLGVENSVLASLTCVSTLVISSAFFVDLNQAIVDIMPQWLLLFPSVEHVKYMEQPEDQAKLFKNSEFLERLALTCRNIKTVEVHRRQIDLEEMRCGPLNEL